MEKNEQLSLIQIIILTDIRRFGHFMNDHVAAIVYMYRSAGFFRMDLFFVN